jgi:hypothetical protein
MVVSAGPRVGAAPPDATCLTRNTLRICVDPPPSVNGGFVNGQELNLLTAQIAVPGQATTAQIEIGLTGSGLAPLEIFDSVRPANQAPLTATPGTSTDRDTGQCTQADLDQPRVGGLPAARRVTVPQQIGQFQLDPPATGVKPQISDQTAFAKAASHFKGGVGGGTLEIFLGIYHGPFSFNGKLVWVIDLHGAAVTSGRIIGGVDMTFPLCSFGDLYAVVDADTGELLLTA